MNDVEGKQNHIKQFVMDLARCQSPVVTRYGHGRFLSWLKIMDDSSFHCRRSILENDARSDNAIQKTSKIDTSEESKATISECSDNDSSTSKTKEESQTLKKKMFGKADCVKNDKIFI